METEAHQSHRQGREEQLSGVGERGEDWGGQAKEWEEEEETEEEKDMRYLYVLNPILACPLWSKDISRQASSRCSPTDPLGMCPTTCTLCCVARSICTDRTVARTICGRKKWRSPSESRGEVYI